MIVEDVDDIRLGYVATMWVFESKGKPKHVEALERRYVAQSNCGETATTTEP